MTVVTGAVVYGQLVMSGWHLEMVRVSVLYTVEVVYGPAGTDGAGVYEAPALVSVALTGQ